MHSLVSRKEEIRGGNRQSDCGKELPRSWCCCRRLEKYVQKEEVDGVKMVLEGQVPG